jgi:lysozyme
MWLWFINLFKKKADPAPVIILPTVPAPVIIPEPVKVELPKVEVPKVEVPDTSKKPVYGIDVYHNDGIDWDKISSDDVAFMIIKATEGESVEDSKFAEYRAKAQAKGIITGAYHFYRSNKDPLKQAKNFIAQLGELKVGELPPVLDWETEDDAADGADIEEIKLWLDYVEGRTGVTPIIYSGSSFIGGKKLPPSFKRYPLWVAHYTNKAAPTVPAPWKDFTIWQKTDSQVVKGVKNPCDYNIFNGSLNDLKKLCK